MKSALPTALAAAAVLTSPALSHADSFRELKELAATAAPPSISTMAAYYYLDPDGVLMTLRAGTNGWWCIAPSLARRGPMVPMCGNAVGLDWLKAWIDGREPTPGAPGFIYALAGGRDASALDPFKAEPDGNLPWLETGPMVMIVNPSDAELTLYPATAYPDTSAPYVMWPDTPFSHLRLPVE